MDYNKLMAELDKEILGSFESTSSNRGLSATEGYDEIEKDLMEGLNVKEPIVEVEGEEDLIFEDGEGISQVDTEENESAEDLMVKSVKTYLESLINEGVEAEEAAEKILELVNSVLPKEEGSEGEDSGELGEPEDLSAEESVTPESPEEEAVEGVDEETKTLSSTESASFEEYQKDKEAKMLKRYKQLANKDLDKKKVAIEGLGETEISIDDQAISRVSGEYGYSGKNLRKMVAEAIQRGDI